MAMYSFVFVIIVGLLHEVISLTFVLKEDNVCPSSGQISHELAIDRKIRCAAVCKADARCLSFCFSSALQSCRISSIHIDSVQNMAASGYKMYSLASFGSGFLRFGDKGYQYISTSLTNDQARSHCSGMGASLALPTNDGENEFLTSFGYTDGIWILADDYPHEGIWKNTDTDENIIYANWGDLQPDNYAGDEHCVILWETTKWIDVHCDGPYEFVCEKTIQN